MNKTTTIIAMIGGLTLGSAMSADAQTPANFLNISAGSQFQSRTFSAITTFELFGETGSVTANQTVGSGFVFDVTGGRRFWRSLGVAVGVSTFTGSGSAAAIAAIPNPLFFGKHTLKTFTDADYGDLKQSTVAINFQIVWMKALTDRLDLSIFAGPSVMRVKQELASGTAELNSVAAISSESKTTARAGTGGVDLTYRLNDRYGIGGFVRYAGGEAEFEAVPKLKVGGAQAGGGIRIRF